MVLREVFVVLPLLGLPYRILNISHKKELLRGLWVGYGVQRVSLRALGLRALITVGLLHDPKPLAKPNPYCSQNRRSKANTRTLQALAQIAGEPWRFQSRPLKHGATEKKGECDVGFDRLKACRFLRLRSAKVAKHLNCGILALRPFFFGGGVRGLNPKP